MPDGNEQEEKRGAGARLEMSDTRKGSYVGWLIGASKDLAPGFFHTGRIMGAMGEALVAVGSALMSIARKVNPGGAGES